jgi:MFS family permease
MGESATTIPQPPRTQVRRLGGAALLGSSIEWYDFFIFATAAALVFPKLFFPGESVVTGVLLSFGTFWAGFIARPIGGLVFGHVGDRLGRKKALVICLTTTAATTFCIGLLPTAGAIGVAAPLLLVLLRFAQGIAIGGQWGGMILLLTESANPKRRGMMGTFGQMGVPFGVILGNVAFLVIGAVASDTGFASWGWRIPFLLSALLFPVVLFIQLRVEDSPVFRRLKSEADKEEAAHTRLPVFEAIRKHPKKIILGAGLLCGSNSTFYITISGLLDYATRELHVARDPLLVVVLLGSFLSAGAIFGAGALSDRLGRKPLMYAGGVVVALAGFPFFWLVDTGSLPLIFVATTITGIGSSLTYGPLAAHLSDLFEPHVRYSGASAAYQLAAIVISGGTPFLMTLLLEATHTSMSVAAYIAIMGVLTVLCVRFLPETHKARAAAS